MRLTLTLGGLPAAVESIRRAHLTEGGHRPAPTGAQSWRRLSEENAAYAAAAEAFDRPLVAVDECLLRACGAAGIGAIHLDDLSKPGGRRPQGC